MRPGNYADHAIGLDHLRAWFLRDDETNGPDDGRPNRAERAEAEEYLLRHHARV